LCNTPISGWMLGNESGQHWHGLPREVGGVSVPGGAPVLWSMGTVGWVGVGLGDPTGLSQP